MSGLHRSPYHGFSVEFTDYRQYAVGDDLRYLDWKLFARRDRYYIKRFEDETNLRCHLLLDLSNSMAYGSIEYNKADYARTVAATLAWFLNHQRDAVGLLTFGDSIEEMIPPRFRTGHLRRIMVALERSTTGKSTDIGQPLEQIAQTVSKRGLVVLISDFLTPVEQLDKNLGYLCSRGHDVILIRVLDPTELDFEFTQPTLFQDVESGREIYVDPKSIKENYQRQFEEHEKSIRERCQDLGVDFFQFRTTDPLDSALFHVLQTRALAGQQVNRANQVKGATR